MRRRDPALVILGAFALGACASGGGGSPQSSSTTAASKATTSSTGPLWPAVPEAWKSLAAELAADLDAALERYEGTAGPRPVFAAELLTANGNQGPALLSAGAAERDRLMLDALQRLGARGVTVDIPYPLLATDFPRANEYLAYYRALGDEIRTRGLELLVETQVPFTGTEYSPLDVDWSALTDDEFLAGRTAQAVTIAREIRPDRLAFVSEPATQAMLTGHQIETDRLVQFINDTIAAIGPDGNVALGGGTGSWEEPAFFARLATETALDFLDIHVYPLATPRQDLLDVAARMADLARDHGKEAVIGEAWLYKAGRTEVGTSTAFTEAFRRDAYPFWGPLDAQFIDVIAALARAHAIVYVSVFWSQLLFAYLPSDAPEELRLADARRRTNAAAPAAMRDGAATEAGAAFRRATARS